MISGSFPKSCEPIGRSFSLQESRAADFLSPRVIPRELANSPMQKAAPFSTHISLMALSATPAIGARAAKPLISMFLIFINWIITYKRASVKFFKKYNDIFNQICYTNIDYINT